MATIELDDLIGQHREAIAEGVRKQLVEKVTQQIGWTAEHKISEAVGKFVEEEIAPELQTYLTTHREEIVDQVLGSMKQVFETLAVKVTEKALKNLGNEYKVRNVVKEIFADF